MPWQRMQNKSRRPSRMTEMSLDWKSFSCWQKDLLAGIHLFFDKKVSWQDYFSLAVMQKWSLVRNSLFFWQKRFVNRAVSLSWKIFSCRKSVPYGTIGIPQLWHFACNFKALLLVILLSEWRSKRNKMENWLSEKNTNIKGRGEDDGWGRWHVTVIIITKHLKTT